MSQKDNNKNLKRFKEFDPKKYINVKPKLNEEVKKDLIVISFGRMNPITIGHEKLVNVTANEAIKRKADAGIFLSHSQDAKKNPLSYEQKLKFAQKAFGSIVKPSKATTIIEVLKVLQNKYRNVVVVVGADRLQEFDSLLNKYNQKDYSFDNIEVISAGERDPDSEGIEGMSASKMRGFATQGNFDKFKIGLPKRLQSIAKEVYDVIRKQMGVKESLDGTYSRKKAYQDMRYLEDSTSSPLKMHRVNVTVSEPDHTMVSRRKEKIQKIVAVRADSREHALSKATQYYKDRGYKVHGQEYIGLKEEAKEQFAIMHKVAKKILSTHDDEASAKDEWKGLDQSERPFYKIVKTNKKPKDFSMKEQNVDKFELSGYVIIDGYVFKDSGKIGRSTYGRYTIKDPDYVKDPKEVGMHRNYRKPDFLSFSTLADAKKWVKTQPKKSASEIEAVYKKYSEREQIYNEEITTLDESINDVKNVGEKIALYAQALRPGHMDKKDLMKVASLLKQGKMKEAIKFASDLDSDPRDYVIHMMSKLKENIKLDERAPLTVAQRRKRAILMRKIKSRIVRGRERAARKLATMPILKKRARRRAIQAIKDKLAKGQDYADLTYGQKVAIDKRLQKIPARRIDILARRLLPVVRKSEKERFLSKLAGPDQQKKEESFRSLNTNFSMLIERLNPQDKDVSDLPGSQPKGYYKGVPKDKKDDRALHFAKHSKMDDSDPRAYKPAPGDEDVKTKTSKYTKRFKDMFGEGRKWGYDKYVDNYKKITGKTPDEKVKEIEAMQRKLAQQRAEFEARHKKVEEIEEASCRDAVVKKRPHMALEKNGAVKFDNRFKIFRRKQELKEETTADFVKEIFDLKDSVESLYEKEMISGLKAKAEKTGIPYDILKKVFDRGLAAWKGGHRPGATPHQWAYARVNSFVTGGKTQKTADADLWAKIKK